MRYVHLIIVSIIIIARQICNEGGYTFIEFLNIKFAYEIQLYDFDKKIHLLFSLFKRSFNDY